MEEQAKELYDKGIKLENQNAYEEAIKYFNAAVALDVNHEMAWFWKGWCSSKLNNYQQAIESYQKAIQLNPKDDVTWNNKGFALDSLGKYQDAVEAYNQAIQLNPNNDSAWNNKGGAFDSLGKYQDAVEAYNQAIQLNPNNDSAWNNKGGAFDSLGKYQDAVEAYNQAIQLNPKNDSTWNKKGAVLNNLGKYSEAVEALNQAIQLNPKNDSAWSNKGGALDSLGKYQDAVDSYNMAISIQPNCTRFYNRGCTLESLKRDKEALQRLFFKLQPQFSFQEALNLNPNYKDAQNKINEIQKKLEDQQKEENVTSQQGSFVLQLTEEQQNQFVQQFIGKLSADSAFEWIAKFLNVQTQNMNEVCCYYSHIFPIMIAKSEVQSIQIELYNAKRGGFANIHYGIFKDEVIAIKEQLFQSSQNPLEFISMLREISILVYCNHPNITKIMAVYFDPKQMKVWTIQPRYLVDLHEALFEQKKLIPKKQDLLIQLLSALDYIHSQGFVHLDIKPKNIMFSNPNCKKIFLLDFGITKFERNSETEILGMSSFYSAPEVSKTDKSLVSSKSDMFSFGIVLYEFITGSRAWQNQLVEGGQAVYELLKGQYKFFNENKSTGNPALDKLILDCVEKDPKQRPTAKEAIGSIQSIKF